MLSYLMTQASLKQRRKVPRMTEDEDDDTDNEDTEAARMEVLFNEDLEP